MAYAQLQVAPHLSFEELTARYKGCRHAAERARWQVIWLAARPIDPPASREIAAVTGLDPRSIQRLIGRYNRQGASALVERRGRAPSSRAALSPDQRAWLEQALESPPGDGGLWTSAKVADWIGALTGKRPHTATGWVYLKKLDQSLQVPRPAHTDSASPEEQAAYKKGLSSGSRPSNSPTPRRRWSSGARTRPGSA